MKSLKTSLLILTTLVCMTPRLYAATTKGLLKINAHRAVAYEFEINDENETTLILMPGIFRGLSTRTQDALLGHLSEKRINWVSYHFSSHPESIIQNQGQSTESKNIDTQLLAHESRLLVQHLKIQKPLYVSLSYSSTVTSTFTNQDTPLMIEAAPLGKQNEVTSFFDSLIAKNNALCGPLLTKLNLYCLVWDSSKVGSYHFYWNMVVSGLEKVYPELKDPTLRSQAVNGYVAMANAVESYNFAKLNFKAGPERIFIIAENEEPARKEIQFQAIKAYTEQRGQAPYVFIIKNAGHIIPTDQPVAYLSVLAATIKKQLPQDSAFQYVDENGVFSKASSEVLRTGAR